MVENWIETIQLHLDAIRITIHWSQFFFFLFDTYTNTRFVFVYLAEEFNSTVAKSVAFPNLELTSVKQILQVVEFLSGSLKPKCLEFTSSATFVNTCFRIPETRVLIGCWKTL